MERIQILLADDDEDDRFFFERALTDAAIQADLKAVEDGRKLLQYVSTEISNLIPDIIFLDINMPFKNGIECLKELRQVPELETVPVLMFSTSADERHIDDAFALGANRYVRKPMSLKEEVVLFKKIFQSGWQETLKQIQKKDFLIE